MHAKNFCSDFLDIFKNDFRPAGAYAPISQSGFPLDLGGVCLGFWVLSTRISYQNEPNTMASAVGFSKAIERTGR
jgi:hypothetical protein